MGRILAHDKHTALLQDGKVKPIGYIHDLGTRNYQNGQINRIEMVEFDFDNNGKKDLFFFRNDILEYFFVEPTREQFVKDVYAEIAGEKGIKLNSVIKAVKYVYMDEMMYGKAYGMVAELKKACK